MKNKLFTFAVLFFVLVLAVESIAINNPVGSGRVPASDRRGGLVRSPNPLAGNSGNLLITGNVAGDKYFRGVVPYNSVSSFEGSTNTTTLDSFLRRSAGTGDYSGKYQPYYSETATVTGTRPGNYKVFTPPVANFGNRSANEYLDLRIPDRQTTTTRQNRTLYDSGLRPMALNEEEIERVLANESLRAKSKKVGVKYTNIDKLEFSEPQEIIGSKKYDEQQDLTKKELRDSIAVNVQKSEQLKYGDDESESNKSASLLISGKVDVYDQMKQQIMSPESRLEYINARNLKTSQVKDAAEEADKIGKEFSKKQLAEYKSFASPAKDKFNETLRAAEDYLKTGQYYKAADAYTLAGIYKRSDPLVYAGKSHALFAAGEYMSSALFLSRALDIFPEYVRFKVDLVSMVGDKDKLESRTADVEFWLEKTNATELHFLLGYVYYQMGRIDKAKEHIDIASEEMGQSAAILELKAVIDKAAELGMGIEE